MKPQSNSIQSSSRRQVVVGLAGLSLATLLADPTKVARAAASLQTVTAKTPSGRSVSAALAVPDGKPAAAVMLVHEWWGLNDQIKSVATEIAKQGWLGLAIDLYGGKLAGNPDEAGALMKAVVPAEASETMSTWVDWLRQNPDCNGKVASIGWCFGGGMALQAAMDRPLGRRAESHQRSCPRPVRQRGPVDQSRHGRRLRSGDEAGRQDAGGASLRCQPRLRQSDRRSLRRRGCACRLGPHGRVPEGKSRIASC
jgi:hypothetical protein